MNTDLDTDLDTDTLTGTDSGTDPDAETDREHTGTPYVHDMREQLARWAGATGPYGNAAQSVLLTALMRAADTNARGVSTTEAAWRLVKADAAYRAAKKPAAEPRGNRNAAAVRLAARLVAEVVAQKLDPYPVLAGSTGPTLGACVRQVIVYYHQRNWGLRTPGAAACLTLNREVRNYRVDMARLRLEPLVRTLSAYSNGAPEHTVNGRLCRDYIRVHVRSWENAAELARALESIVHYIGPRRADGEDPARSAVEYL